VLGAYGFTASRAGFFLLGATPPGSNATLGSGPIVPVAVTPQGTTGTTTTTNFSTTSIGALVSGLSSPRVFSAVGRVFFDGVGHIYASPTTGLLTNTQVGTYNVTSDCGITVTLNDPFATGAVGPTVTTPTTGTVSLEGEILDTLDTGEIDLVSSGTTATGALVTLVKTAQFSSCTNASLTGNFGIVAQGMVTSGTTFTATTPTGTVGLGTTTTAAFGSGVTGTLGTPFTLLGRFVADGSGNLVTDLAATTSPLKRSLTGTYIVNADCTGTAHLVDSNGTARNISFILVNASGPFSVQTSVRQELQFVFTDTGVIGTGNAEQQ